MPDYKIENTSGISVTSGKVAHQNDAVMDPLTRQLERVCDLIGELKDEQSSRRHGKTTSLRATSSSSGCGFRSVTREVKEHMFQRLKQTFMTCIIKLMICTVARLSTRI